MKSIILAVLLSFSVTSFADEWRAEDTHREITYQVIAAIDWGQTRNIARNPDKLYETNVILGKHPSVDRVDAYFAATALAHYAVSKALPVEYRSAWQYVSISFEAGVVARNFNLGIGVSF